MMTIFSYLHRTTFVERCCNTFVSSIPLCALWDSTISGITEGDTSDSSSAKGAVWLVRWFTGWHLQLQSGTSISLLFHDYMGGRSGLADHVSTAWCTKPCSGKRQAVSRGLRMPESHPQPWGGVKLESAVWTSTAGTHVCPQGPKSVTMHTTQHVMSRSLRCCRIGPHLQVILHFEDPSSRETFQTNLF